VGSNSILEFKLLAKTIAAQLVCKAALSDMTEPMVGGRTHGTEAIPLQRVCKAARGRDLNLASTVAITVAAAAAAAKGGGAHRFVRAIAISRTPLNANVRIVYLLLSLFPGCFNPFDSHA
jgi:hypothetical protein